MPLDLPQVLNSHKNRLLEVVQNSDIPISRLKSEEKGRTFTVRVVETPIQFIMRQSEGDLKRLECCFSEFKPGFPMSAWIPPGAWANIDQICVEFIGWLTDVVKNYIELAGVPDRWIELNNIQPFLLASSFTESDFGMFTEDEKVHIQDAISEFQRLIIEELSPIKEDLNRMQEKMDYLSDAVSRLNRFDWKGVAMSTVLGIATNPSVDVDTGKRILELFQQAFGTAIKLLPK